MSITYTPFLSPGWATIYAKYTLYDAWYSGDAERLARCYAEQIATPNNQRSLFWARSRKDEVSASVHAPVAGDIAATSAALLFSERPSIIIADAHIENAPADAIKTQDRLNALLAGECDYLPHCRFDAAAESAAAFGGVFLKINWAKALCSMPIISVVHADAALPEFSQGMLTACTFWTFDDAREERIEERYVKGAIITRRYKAGLSEMGVQTGVDEVLETGVDELLCRYIPNRRPNRLFRNGVGQHLGQSDIAGLESLMDTIDEILTDWLRDIQLAKGRIIAPEQLFERTEDANGKVTRAFNIDTQAYMGINTPAGMPIGEQLTVSQFAIRSDEHEKALINFYRLAVTMAGYAPQSFGLDTGGTVESGEAIKDKERKSYLTRDKKAPYWEGGLADILYLAQMVDAKHFGSGITPMRPQVKLSDAISPDQEKTARTLNLLSTAKAASIDTLITMAHPDWSLDQINAEVARVKEEQMMTGPDPTQIGLV